MPARALRLVTALLIALTVGLGAPPAEAQTRGQIRRARVLFARGLRQYDRHRYTAALRTFTRAYQLASAPAVVYNIAQCHVALGDEEHAIESYELFLQLSPDAPNRAEVERKVRELRAHVNYERRQQQQRMVAEVRREQERIVDHERVDTEREEARRGGHVRLVSWITLGTGVVATGLGLLFHLDAVAKQDELNDPQLDCSRALGRCLDLVDAGDRSALLRTILLPAGGAILVTGVLMMIVNLGTEDPPEELALSPSLGPGHAALEVRGTW